jgi:hypothetical protein
VFPTHALRGEASDGVAVRPVDAADHVWFDRALGVIYTGPLGLVLGVLWGAIRANKRRS